MAVPRREMTGGSNVAESSRRVRNHHRGECAVDLASSCTYDAAPFRHVPMPLATTATENSAASSSRKRPRVVADETTTFFPSDATTDERRLAATDDVDDPALLLRRRLRWKQSLQAVKTAVAWRLAAKDDEIRQTRQEMAERLRCACAESQTWENIAMAREGEKAELQSEKAALQSENAALRGELDHVLRAKVMRWHDEDDDAESCCYGDNFTADKEEAEGGGGPSTAARCFGCGERACCWHLCAACAAAAWAWAWACPACGYANMDDVHVNYYMV